MLSSLNGLEMHKHVLQMKTFAGLPVVEEICVTPSFAAIAIKYISLKAPFPSIFLPVRNTTFNSQHPVLSYSVLKLLSPKKMGLSKLNPHPAV